MALFVWASWSAGQLQWLKQWCEFGTRKRSKHTQNVMFANPKCLLISILCWGVFSQTPVKEPNSENVDISTGGGVTGWKTKCCSWTDTHSYSHTLHTHNLFFYLSLSHPLIPHFCLTLFRSVLLTGFSVKHISNVSHTHDCLLTSFLFLIKKM